MNPEQEEAKKVMEIIDKRNSMIKEYGWTIDAVYPTEDSKSLFANIHTHGLEENFSHKDLQCVMPIDPETIHDIFSIIIEKIKNGDKFEEGKCYSGVLNGDYKVRLVKARESGREVLRVILPDKNNKLHREIMEDPYGLQYSNIETEM